MEGGYVNEAVINSQPNTTNLPNPLLASATSNSTALTAPSSPPPPPPVQAQPSSAAQTPEESAPQPTNSRNLAPLQGLVDKIRNLNLQDTKQFKERFRFEFYAKDKFTGGQLKTKNGQKYVFNGPPSGVFISKTCAAFTAIIVVLALISSILATYFITLNSVPNTGCLNGHSAKSESTPQRINNTPVGTASMFGAAPPPMPPAPATVTQGSSVPNVTQGPSKTTQYHEPSLPAPVGDIPNEIDLFDLDNKPATDLKLQLYEGWSPLHYTLVIEPNLSTSSNNGTILIEVQRDSNIPAMAPIVLDVHNITISNVRVVRSASASLGEEVDLDFDSEYGEDNSTFIITLPKTLSEEQKLSLILSMDFVSHITETLQGVYKASYINLETNKKEWMISTQLSPIDARRAFPCFDRPDKKANFTISIIRENKMAMALSNMPSKHSSPHRPGYTRDDFETTPKMPTYLVAFIVCNLVESGYGYSDSSLSPRVEIFTRPESKKMTHYAYSMVRKFLPYYEDYFGIKNRLPKIDLVSVPDFGFGAMENWGLITFRDSALLVPEDLEKASSSEHMEYVAQIIAHELAHQWFGNLVTHKWWDDLWLKEGFACYLSYLALNHVHPEYQIMETFTVLEFTGSMQHDADNSSHAISFDVKSTNDIRRIFDPITYSKGAILLRMLNSIVGDDAFRAATQDLLKSFAYENADRNDLWEFMTRQGHKKGTLLERLHVKDIMNTWISQPGYPVVSVDRVGVDLVLTQERYLLPSRNANDNSRWVIPITYETDELHKGDSIPTHWMLQDEHQIIVKDVFTSENNTENVVYLNMNRQGYYRVKYDTDSWLALKKKFNTLPRITRAQLLDDSLHLAQAEYITYDIPLTFLMELFTATDDELLWSAAHHGLTYLTYMLQREPAYETYRAFIKFIVRPAFDRYGLNEPDNESHLQLQHRAGVASLACRFNYDRCTMPAHRKYREWMSNPNANPIKPNMKPVIYCTAIAEGSFQEWYFAYKQYKSTMSASEKEQILTSLGCTTKPWLLSKYLNMTISATSGILKQDGARAFGAVARNPIGYEIAFDFLQTNIKEISEYFGDGFSTLSSMIDEITTYMNKDYHKEQLKQFGKRARKLGLKSVEGAIELAMEQVNNNIHFRKRSYYDLKGFLETIVSEFRINIF